MSIYSMFNDDTYGEAVEYLTYKLSQSAIVVDKKGDKICQSKGLDVMREVVKRFYGINVPLMANYRLVEDLTLDKYIEYIYDYIESIKAPIKILTYCPLEVLVPLVLLRGGSPSEMAPIGKWDPDEKWNLAVRPESKDKAISSPLNEFIHLDLIISGKALYKKNFITHLYDSRELTAGQFQKYIDSLDEDLVVNVLPCNNLDRILHIAECLFQTY